MTKGDKKFQSDKMSTILTHLGSNPHANGGVLMPPIYKATTIVQKDVRDILPGLSSVTSRDDPLYGRVGNPTARMLAMALGELENTNGPAIIGGGGLITITTALLAFLDSGDHIICTSPIYGCTKHFLTLWAKKYNIEVSYFDVNSLDSYESLFQKNTKVVFIESPSSATFEIYDVPKICDIARKKGAITMADNTWASPVFCNVLDLGVDISLYSCAKFIGGHCDTFLGFANTKNDTYREILFACFRDLGITANSDDCYNILRGLKTLHVRLKSHQESAIKIATQLESHPLVHSVSFPALKSHKQHNLWKRDFTGAAGVFSFQIHNIMPRKVLDFIDHLRLISVGFSWGGFESLIVPCDISSDNSTWDKKQNCSIRLSVGLEDVDDIILDLKTAMQRLDK